MRAAAGADHSRNVIEEIGRTNAIACSFANHHKVGRTADKTGGGECIPATATCYIAKRTVHSLICIVVACIAGAF